MKPLIVLITVSCLSLLTIKITRGKYEFVFSGRIALSAMFVFSAMGHFTFTQGMALMIPEFIPFKTEIIYLTGGMEILFAIGLFFPDIRVPTAWLIIAFLILALPANIYASVKHIDIQKATFDGNGLNYLWFRIPLQILFIVWTYLCAIKYK
ncbi:MAG TPA: hypothetical protein DDZ96_11585 [Porphyromonadaceae bacterium]|jgi:uncharacterized membrane protein|nr:hypothetical protein [Porphyromonadaceae bacterium]HBL34440.1 hypothetical protein [Porphyromonadaceae bacterium]